MVIAQAIGEYGGGAMIGGISNVILNVIDEVTRMTPSTYLTIIGVAFAIWFLFSNRRR